MPLAHSSSLRTGRTSEPGRIYLVTTKTIERRPFFADFRNGRQVVSALRWTDEQNFTRTWAFVVMPDHLHWLVELGAMRALSDVVHGVKWFSGKQINRRLGRQGPVWQPGFHDHALRREESVREAARYVVMNPVRAGLVRSVREYSLWDACWI